MAGNWDERMQQHFDRLQAALSAELRTQLTAQLATIRADLGAQHTDLRTELSGQHSALKAELIAQQATLRSELIAQQAALRTELTDQQAALRTELSAQLAATKIDLATQLEATSTQLEHRLEKGLEARLGQRISVQAEELREIVRTAADNYGDVLGGLRRDIAEFRDEWRKNADVTDKMLANHLERIVVLEQVTGVPRE